MKPKYSYTLHPSFVESDNGKPALAVLEHFAVDRTLPKHLSDDKKVVLDDGTELTIDEYFKKYDRLSMYRRSQSAPIKKTVTGFLPVIKAWFKNRKKDTRKIMLNVKSLLKENILTEEMVVTDVQLDQLITEIYENGQRELADKLRRLRPVLVQERILLNHGYTKYISESDMIHAFEKAEFPLRLDFLENYSIPLPKDVAEKKKQLDEWHAFDNWVVLHYDPDGIALKSIKEEEKRRDPILFGMIEGSNRFYYVADWVTKKDDVTLDKILGILGKKSANTVVHTERIRTEDEDNNEVRVRSTNIYPMMGNSTSSLTTQYDPVVQTVINRWITESSDTGTHY